MSNTKKKISLLVLKQRYSHFDLSDDLLESFYHTACENEPNNISSAFHKLIMKYVKEHISYEMLKGFLEHILIDPLANASSIEKKLLSFFNILDSINYTLTFEDGVRLVKEDAFRLFFEKKFRNKDKISFDFYETLTNDNINMGILCDIYLNEHNIEIIESHNNDRLHSGVLSRSENIELVKKAQNGDNLAKEKLITSNYGLIQKFVQQYSYYGVEFEDLTQEGIFGLMKAINRFDTSKECAFSTYASFWIRQSIVRLIDNQSHVIRLPVHLNEKVRKIHNAKNEFIANLGHEPSIAELADFVGMSEKQVKYILKSSSTVISLQSKVNGEEDSDELGYFIEDNNANVAQEVLANYESELLLQYMKEKLTDKQFQVLCYRFGLNNQPRMTLEEISNIYGVTRERIRQIELKAKKKLEKVQKVKALWDDSLCPIVQVNKTIDSSKTEKNTKTDDSSETIKYTKFDIHTIHPEITMDLFLYFVKCLPSRMQKNYCIYRAISLKYNAINIKKEQEYDSKVLSYMEYVEQLLKEMYRYYRNTSCIKHLTEEEVHQKIIKHMNNYSLAFKYKDYTFKDIYAAIHKLNSTDKSAFIMRYGKNLHEFHDFPKDGTKAPNYYNALLYRAHKKLERALKNPSPKVKPIVQNRKSILQEIEHDKLVEIVKKIPLKQKEIMYLRHGENLDCTLPFPPAPENRCHNYYYVIYQKAVEKIRFYVKDDYYLNISEKVVKANKKTSIIEEVEHDKLVEIVKMLPKKQKEIMYLRHGENLDCNLPFPPVPENRCNNYYYVMYRRATKKIRFYVKDDYYLHIPEKVVKANQQTSIIAEVEHDKLVEIVKILPKKQKEVMYLRHGENLDCTLPFPPVPENRCNNYYYTIYQKAVEKIRFYAKDDYYLNISEKVVKTNKKTSIIAEVEHDKLVEIVKRIPLKQKEIMYLRHGENLDCTLPFPPAPENRCNNYYYTIYQKTVAKIRFYAKDDYYLNISEKVVKTNKKTSIIKEIEHDKLVEIVKMLPKKQKEIMYLRHGENLDCTIPFPPVPENRCNNYYYVIYQKAVVRIRLYAKEDYYLSVPEKAVEANQKTSIIEEIEHDKLVEIVKRIPLKQKEIMYLRHGENLDCNLPFPPVPENRCNNYYYVMYRRATKKIRFYAKDDYYLSISEKAVNANQQTSIIAEVEHDKLVEIVKMLPKKQKEIMYIRHGENLDCILPFPPAPENQSRSCYYSIYQKAVEKIHFYVKDDYYLHIPEKVMIANQQISIIEEVEHDKLVEIVKKISPKQKEIMYLRHGENLDCTKPFPPAPENRCRNYYYSIYQKTVAKIRFYAKEDYYLSVPEKAVEANQKTSIIEENKLAEPIHQCEKEQVSSKKKSNKKKIKKKQFVEQQRQELTNKKIELEQIKLQKYMAELYDQYTQIYGKFVTGSEMKKIIEEAVQSYSYSEGLSLELSTPYKIETAILIQLSNQYKNNPDSEESLELLLSIEELFGARIKERYTNCSSNMSYCYVSDDLISKAVEETLKNYTGRLPFYVELSLKIKKQIK